MPTIEALGLGVGDKVGLRTPPHTVYGMGNPPKEDFTLEILGFGKVENKDAVYLSYEEKLRGWAWIQNTETGEVDEDSVKIRIVPKEERQEEYPLAANERLIIALKSSSDGFTLPVVTSGSEQEV